MGGGVGEVEWGIGVEQVVWVETVSSRLANHGTNTRSYHIWNSGIGIGIPVNSCIGILVPNSPQLRVRGKRKLSSAHLVRSLELARIAELLQLLSPHHPRAHLLLAASHGLVLQRCNDSSRSLVPGTLALAELLIVWLRQCWYVRWKASLEALL